MCAAELPRLAPPRRAPSARKNAARRGSSAPPVQALLAFVLALGAGACKPEGAPYRCQCELLTDYDDAQKETATVCATSPGDAPAVARGCVALAAPMPIQGCTCSPANDLPAVCREGCLH